ncbi:MAG: hypothetical protein ACMG6E_01555 [Candidatus Roizmanbacteria bacterium]
MSDNFSSIDHILDSGNRSISVGSAERGQVIVEQPPHQEAPLRELVEHEPDAEVAEVVEVKKDVVDVPPDLQQIGVQSTGTSDFVTEKEVELPLPDEQVYKGLSAPITSALRWFAESCLKILKKAHQTLKVVHGHVVRVATSKKMTVQEAGEMIADEVNPMT